MKLRYNLFTMTFYVFVNFILDTLRWKIKILKKSYHIYDINDFKYNIEDAYRYYYVIFRWLKCDNKKYKYFYPMKHAAFRLINGSNYPEYVIFMRYRWFIYFIIYKKLNKKLHVKFKEILKLPYEMIAHKSFRDTLSYELRKDVPKHCIDEWNKWA